TLLAAPTTQVRAQETPRAKLLTGPDDGTYQAMGRELSQKTAATVSLDLVTSDGSLSNLIVTSLAKADLCLTQADAFLFLSSQPEYERPMANLVAVMPLYMEEIHILVNKKAGIAKLADLRGKKVNIGIGASGHSVSSLVLLDALEIPEDAVDVYQFGREAALTKTAKGELDASIFVGGAPLGFLKRSKHTAQLELLGLDKETVQQLTTDMPYWEATIPAGTYPGQEGAIQTVATLCLLVSHKSTPNAIVGPVTEFVLQCATEASGHPKWKEVSPDLARELVEDPSLSFHPAARKVILGK
ncbi:MAG: TAXI family TRAP transporter solute-binding subunit, partial [Planctomycetota bacterium]